MMCDTGIVVGTHQHMIDPGVAPQRGGGHRDVSMAACERRQPPSMAERQQSLRPVPHTCHGHITLRDGQRAVSQRSQGSVIHSWQSSIEIPTQQKQVRWLRLQLLHVGLKARHSYIHGH
jgi:hypothetical protein